MSMVSTTPYRKPVPRPPIETDVWPRFGIGILPDYTDIPEMDNVFMAEHIDPQVRPQINFAAASDIMFYYYLCPVEYGACSFRDASGLAGGFDGASWPIDDIGEEYGPVLVTYKGMEWNLYRTDFPGGRGGLYTVSFANG